MERLSPKRTRRRGIGYVLLAAFLLAGSYAVDASTWQGSVNLHTWLETIATLLGLVTGAMAMVRYYSKKSGTFLFLGTAYLGGALLDGYHALVTSMFMAGHVPTALSDLTPWSGIMSRVFVSVLMCASVVAWGAERRRATEGGINEAALYWLAGLWVVITFAFFALLRVPPPFHPNQLIRRPADFVPAFLFGLATLGYLLKGWWKTDNFEHCLVLSLILSGMSRLAFLSFYHRPLGAQFFLGHMVNILGLIAVLVGLFISMFSIFQSEARSAIDLLQAKCSLATELERERRLVADMKATEYRASHDSLTGIHNRSAIMQLLIGEVSRSKRSPQPIGVLMADIDHFKAINDAYGHPVGDQVLQQLAARITSSLRPYDSVGRVGGEEFLILAPNCTGCEAAAIGERLRSRIGTKQFLIGCLAIPVTISIGVNVLDPSTPDVDGAVQAADAALYQAKHNGRNRVECCISSNAVEKIPALTK